MDTALNPNQQKILDRLIAADSPRPSYDPDFKTHVRRALEESISDLDEKIIGKGFWVSKQKLDMVHGCESYFESDQDLFEWSVPAARGTVAHKAISLSTGRNYPPAQLVEMAMERLTDVGEQKSLGPFLKSISQSENAELVAEATSLVTSFFDAFPPIKNEYKPRVEVPLKATLLNEAVTLSGKPDIALWQPKGNQANSWVFEIKSGQPHKSHFDEVRYYALLETLRIGVPPFRSAIFYLDSGELADEEVTEETIMSTVRRVSDGIHKMIEVNSGGRLADITPGSQCRFCSQLQTCPKADSSFGFGEDD